MDKWMHLLSHAFSFQGRINRTEYALVLLIGYVLPGLIIALLPTDEIVRRFGGPAIMGPLVLVVPMLWIFFAATTKRFHDLNKSGDYCWSVFVPIVGVIALLILLFQPGDKSRNRFG